MDPETKVAGDITICIDNAEVLSRARGRDLGNKIKDALIMDFDLWMEMKALLTCLRIPAIWKKVDSYITTRVYDPGVMLKGDKFSIRLNEFVDELADSVREAAEKQPVGQPQVEALYYHGQVTVQSQGGSFLW